MLRMQWRRFFFVKFGIDLINISKVTSRKTKWSRFFEPPYTQMCTVKRTVGILYLGQDIETIAYHYLQNLP